MAQFLRAKGYLVELAEDGAEALLLLERKAFDLVISDIVMPRVNGWDLVEHLASSSPGTPVLLMTAYSQVQPTKTLPKAPDVILKPFVLTEILSKVEKLVGVNNPDPSPG